MLHIGLLFLCLFVGLIFVIMAFTEPDMTIGSRIFSFVCGLIFLALPLAFLGTALQEFAKSRKEKKRNGQEEKAAGKNSGHQNKSSGKTTASVGDTAVEMSDPEHEQKNQEEAPEVTALGSFIMRFQRDYDDFFRKLGVAENSGLQFDATQIYWNILALQKKRLDTRHISMRFFMRHREVEGVNTYQEKSYFDGKYQVSEVSDSVEVERTFLREGSPLLTRRKSRVAHFVITSAKQVGNKKIVCPNCGANTTRENLIDGCDYCGTHFTVEDLEDKVSAFRLRDDYEIEYERYKENRSRYSHKVFWTQFCTYTVLISIYYILNFGEMIGISGNVALAVLFIPLTSAFAAGMFAYLGLCFFWFAVFPLIQMKQSLTFYSRRRLDKMKRRYEEDTRAEANIRRNDELFSVAAFYAQLCNKLACIHYASSEKAACTFLEEDREDLFGRYKNVVDMDIEDINVKDYSVGDGLQTMKVEVTARLLEDRDNRLKKRRERLLISLIRTEDCKTQAVCEPAVLTCTGCGNSLSLENGKTCRYCGRTLDLKKKDWVIREYTIR